MYEDNKSTIKIINSKIPTNRTRHMEIRFFAIQGWKDERSIEMKHIPGILNPSDTMTKKSKMGSPHPTCPTDDGTLPYFVSISRDTHIV